MSRLFVASILDPPGELEQKLETAHRLVQNCFGDVDKNVKDKVAAALIREASSNHSNVCIGLLSFILSEPERSSEAFSHLQYAAMDGLATVVSEMQMLVVEQWLRLKELAQRQMVWLVKQMVGLGVPGVEQVVWQLLRWTGGGGPQAAWLSEQILGIMVEHYQWLVKHPFLVAAVAFTLLRLIEDHSPLQPAASWGRMDSRQRRESLIELEAKVAAKLIREQSASVLLVGRDLVRALQQVARVPPIAELWQEILSWPNNFVLSLLATPTPKHFLALRISPDIERKLLFLTQHVMFGKQDKYETWFQQRHLATPESQGLRPDLVRYILGAIHPSNEVLRSGSTPRWAVVGGLLTSCTGQVVSAFTKLAIFYDWVAFVPEKDSVMSLEPAALLMQNTVRSHAQILPNMLDFLLRLGPAFFEDAVPTVEKSIRSAWRLLLSSRVLPGLDLFQGRNLSPELRNKAIEAFEELGRAEDDQQPSSSSSSRDPRRARGPGSYGSPSRDPRRKGSPSKSQSRDPRRASVQRSCTPSAAFSDPEDDVEEVSAEVQDTSALVESDKDIAPALQVGLKLASLDGIEEQAKVVAQLVSILPEAVSLSQALLLAESISRGLKTHFSSSDGGGLNLPTTAIFRLFPETEAAFSPALLTLINNLATLEPRLGSHFIHFLVATDSIEKEAKKALYNKFCVARELQCEAGLLVDLRPCQNEDVDLLVHLVPALFDLMPESTIGNVDLLYLLVSSIDGRQLLGLVQKVVSQHLVLLKPESCFPLLNSSLSWETFEQIAFWQLYHAHDLPVNTLYDLLPHLVSKQHEEAITSVLLIFKRKKPTPEILSHLFKRHPEEDDPVLPCLSLFWMRYSNSFPEVFASFLTKLEHLEGKSMRDCVFKHTSLLLQTCPSLFSSPVVVKGYKKLRSSCDEEEKTKHSDLFRSVFSLWRKMEDAGEKPLKRSKGIDK